MFNQFYALGELTLFFSLTREYRRIKTYDFPSRKDIVGAVLHSIESFGIPSYLIPTVIEQLEMYEHSEESVDPQSRLMIKCLYMKIFDDTRKMLNERKCY